MDELTKLREDSHLSTEDWSRWVKAMVPVLPPQGHHHFEKRSENHRGYICVNIKTAFKGRKCGIYEWKAVGTLEENQTKVVYIGSTCRNKSGALQERIMEYCRNGSHKAVLFDNALERGYELWVRVNETGRFKVEAEDLENDFLSRYNYAWNIRNNALRNVLP